MVLSQPLISNSTNLLYKLLWTIPSSPTIIIITVTFMFYRFFSSLANSKYLSIFSLSFIFILWSAETAKSIQWQVLFSLFNKREAWGLYLKVERILCLAFSRADSGLCNYYYYGSKILISCTIPEEITFPNESFPSLVFVLCQFAVLTSYVMNSFTCFTIPEWITIPTELFPVLYSFCASLQYWLLILLTVSSVSQFPSGSPFPSRRSQSCIRFVPFCNIDFLCY